VTTWLPLSHSDNGLRATVDGAAVYVLRSRLGGWSWHWMPADRTGAQGYAPTLEAAQTMAVAAARGEND
jgi:hypothetical protein